MCAVTCVRPVWCLDGLAHRHYAVDVIGRETGVGKRALDRFEFEERLVPSSLRPCSVVYALTIAACGFGNAMVLLFGYVSRRP
jgi:hypothetical protein